MKIMYGERKVLEYNLMKFKIAQLKSSINR